MSEEKDQHQDGQERVPFPQLSNGHIPPSQHIYDLHKLADDENGDDGRSESAATPSGLQASAEINEGGKNKPDSKDEAKVDEPEESEVLEAEQMGKKKRPASILGLKSASSHYSVSTCR